MKYPKIVRMCKTVYYGPTDHHGSRIRATHMTTKKTATVPYDPALGQEDNHIAAAVKVLGGHPEFGTCVDGGGYIFGLDPRNLP